MDDKNSNSDKLLDDNNKEHNTTDDKKKSNDIFSFINIHAEYANTYYSDNHFIKLLFVFLLLNPLFSLFIKKKNINRMFSMNQIKQLEITIIIILIVSLFNFNSYIDSTHQGYYFIKYMIYIFLIVHLCVANDCELVRVFIAAKNKK